MTVHDEYIAFMAEWREEGGDVASLTCPHCKREHNVPAIPNTDSMAICPHCEELFLKVIDGRGVAHAHVPGVPA